MRRLVLGCALGLCGCIDVELGPTESCLVSCDFPPGQTSIVITPESARLLVGDTITFFAWSCDGTLFCAGAPNAWSDWSIAGDAAVGVLVGGRTSKIVRASTQLVLRGAAAGSSTITAARTSDPSQKATVRVTVADSSVITAIEEYRISPANAETRQVGERFLVSLVLKDALGNRYRARPTAASVSDTSVLAVDGPAVSVFAAVVEQPFRAKNPGTADVTFRFLSLSTTVPIRVVP